MTSSFKTLLKVVITTFLIWWLVMSVDWREVGEIMIQVSVPLLVLYCLLQLVGNLLSAWKWRFLGSAQGFTFSLRDGFFAYLSGAFINNFLPSTIGGDTYRTMWMSQVGERARAATVVVFDRLTGLLALFLTAAVGITFLPFRTLWENPVMGIVVFVVALATVVIFVSLFFSQLLFRIIVTLTSLLPWPQLQSFVGRFSMFADTVLYLKALGMSLLFLLVGVGLSNFALWQALGAGIDFGTFLGCIFLATLIANIPLSVNNIGIKEWAYILVFGLVGMSAELAVTAALLSRLLQMLLSCFALPWYWQQKTVSNKEKSLR